MNDLNMPRTCFTSSNRKGNRDKRRKLCNWGRDSGACKSRNKIDRYEKKRENRRNSNKKMRITGQWRNRGQREELSWTCERRITSWKSERFRVEDNLSTSDSRKSLKPSMSCPVLKKERICLKPGKSSITQFDDQILASTERHTKRRRETSSVD